MFWEHLLKERHLCTFVQFSILNGVYLQLVRAPFELQREHVLCAGHVWGVGVATVSAHKASFKAQ